MSKDDGVVLSDASGYWLLVGALWYLTWTRPDIGFDVNQVCLYMQLPAHLHLIASKRILRYIKHTLDYGLLFYKRMLVICEFSDADWANYIDTRRSPGESAYFLELILSPGLVRDKMVFLGAQLKQNTYV